MPANVIMADVVHEFIEALERLEGGEGADHIAALFTGDAELRTPATEHSVCGREDIREFWRHYQSAFASVHTDFTRILRDGDDVCLEWCSRVSPHNHHAPFTYWGVTLLRLEGGRICDLCSYYDTRPFPSLAVRHRRPRL